MQTIALDSRSPVEKESGDKLRGYDKEKSGIAEIERSCLSRINVTKPGGNVNQNESVSK